MCSYHTLRFTRRDLPHWIVAERIHFVTVSLKGSIPAHVYEELRVDRRRLADGGHGEHQPRAIEQERSHFLKVEAILDSASCGDVDLSRQRLTEAIYGGFAWLENAERGWRIPAATVMSTHVHFLAVNVQNRTDALLTDLGQWKRYTSRSINRVMERDGRVWARDHFDHWCRTDEKVVGATRYIANNPVKAGLVSDWKDWSGTRIYGECAEAAGLT